jgi:hypothetical protein
MISMSGNHFLFIHRKSIEIVGNAWRLNKIERNHKKPRATTMNYGNYQKLTKSIKTIRNQ